MDVATWVAIGSIATSSGVAIAAVWLASKFAYRQAHIGRVWERKAEAYSEILEAMHEIEEWFRAELDDEFLGREVSEEVQAARNFEYHGARKILRRRIAREVWLLPKEAQQRIVSMNTSMSVHQDSWFEHLDSGLFEVRKAIADIAELAERELLGPKS
jgi:hypothetical protein